MFTSSDPLALLDAGLRGALIALLLLLTSALWREGRSLETARAGVRLMLGMCVQMVSSVPVMEWQAPLLWQAPLVGVSVGNAVLFWLFVRALFDDDFRPGLLHFLAWFGVVALSAFNVAVLAGTGSALTRWAFGLQHAVPFFCAVLAIWVAGRDWRGDLVEPRRRLRGFVVGMGVIYSLVQAGLRISSNQGSLSKHAALLDVSLMLLLATGVAWRLMRLAPDELFRLKPEPARPGGGSISSETPKPSQAPDSADERLAENLLHLMRAERLYADENLSLAALAARLAIPEYRLRRAINQLLGHRNFSAFVNGFRLEEAKRALIAPAKRDTPILTIALEAGFQSIGPFNRAFKAATGRTPTEFRRQNIAEF